MIDAKEVRPFEERLAVVESWVKKMGEEGVVEDIDPQLVKGVLEGLGANFEIPEEAKESLGKYSNLNKRLGMDAVWGKDRVDEFKKWLKDEYILGYEEKTRRLLPTLYDRKTGEFDNNKHSGMMQFFGELTAFAAGIKSFADYQRLTENRAKKGREWQERDLSKHYEPSPNAPFPPGFPKAAWDYIRTWKK